MDYAKSYPLLVKELKFLVIDNGLSEDQFKMLLSRGLDENSSLRGEIVRSFDDKNFSWMEILNHDGIGEVCECETEEEAREFATEMFLKPATT